MQQSPPLNASQTLADQHAIYTHNVNSFMLVLSNIPNDADPKYSYLEQKQKAYKLFSIYIMNGSHQNYLNTYDAISDAMDAFQAFNKSRVLQKAKSSNIPTPPDVSYVRDQTDNGLRKVFFHTELGIIQHNILKRYMHEKEVLICSQSNWQDLELLSADKSNTWFYKMLEPLDLNRCPELSTFDILPLKQQYEAMMKIYQLSVALNDDRVRYTTDQILINKFGATEEVTVIDWEIKDKPLATA